MVMLRMLAFRPARIESTLPAGNQAVQTQSSRVMPPKADVNVNSTVQPAPRVAPPPTPITPPSYSGYIRPDYTQATEQNAQIQEPPVTLTPPTLPPLTNNWVDMISAMRLSGLTKELANHCVLESIDDHQCILMIDPGSASIRSARTEETLLKALQTYRGSQLKLVINANTHKVDTPAVQHLKERENRQQAAVDAINADANIQALKEQFGAQVIPDTIEPR